MPTRADPRRPSRTRTVTASLTSTLHHPVDGDWRCMQGVGYRSLPGWATRAAGKAHAPTATSTAAGDATWCVAPAPPGPAPPHPLDRGRDRRLDVMRAASPASSPIPRLSRLAVRAG
jgi:hypothetical protein